MSVILTYATAAVAPERVSVLEHQGIPAETNVPAGIEEVYDEALRLFHEVAEPAGKLKEIAKADFGQMYRGEGRNEPRTPVDDVYVKADTLAIFTVTLGHRISREITDRFESRDLAVGCMLDSVASTAADKLAELAEQRFLEMLREQDRAPAKTGALRYSPGYCGWHISGQGKLFEFLCPDEIGVSLSDSFLMVPLKSVSGVVLAGPKEIHDFDTIYSFCSRCDTKGCRERYRVLEAG